MRDRLISFFATGFGSGLVPFAPGLAGSVVGVGYWWLLAEFGGDFYWLIVALVALFAVWCSGAAARAMEKKDPSCVVIDEIAAVPVALAGLSGWWLVAGFALFRVFDVWKPPGIRQSQALPGGWGIVADDLLAAGAAYGVTHVIVWLAVR
jgi:phosphatidylglycerophosphatase A